MIEVILDKSIIHDYGNIYNKTHRILTNILQNENHVFIINQELIKYFEENVQSSYLDSWKTLFTYLSDTNQFISSQTNTLDSESIFLENLKKYDFSIILANNVSPSLHKDRCELQSTHVSDTLFLELLQFSQMSFRYSNFGNDDEIDNLFEKVLHCSKSAQKIIIIARYGISNCKLIQCLKSKHNNKEYWTTKKKNFPSIEPTNDISYLRTHLGQNLQFLCGHPSDIHERKIIIGNLILEMDEDFDKINTSYKTWLCHCLVNQKIANSLTSKRSALRHFSI